MVELGPDFAFGHRLSITVNIFLKKKSFSAKHISFVKLKAIVCSPEIFQAFYFTYKFCISSLLLEK